MFDTLLAWVALAEGLGIFTLAGLMLLHALGLSLLKKHSRRRVERARARAGLFGSPRRYQRRS